MAKKRPTSEAPAWILALGFLAIASAFAVAVAVHYFN
jgi:hypothetical protein